MIYNERRTFTGAWIETRINTGTKNKSKVAPLRVRELKLECSNENIVDDESHLYGCVNWNTLNKYTFFMQNVAPLRVRELKQKFYIAERLVSGRTFTGAWIETAFTL